MADWHTRPWVVMDVESIGLHGEGFAFGLVVARQGQVVETHVHACAPALAAGTDADRLWVAGNVPPLAETVTDTATLRAQFWAIWMRYKLQGALLFADCTWPVEANFLSACIKDQGPQAAFDGPYPLLDIMTLTSLPGMVIPPRDQAQDLPLHHPLADARYSLRCLQSALHSLGR